ncbi:MAG: DnaJ domain-containing protein [Deltaproteobacteria bacterium]
MSLKDRLFNIARAELTDAARRFREGTRGFLDPDDLDVEDIPIREGYTPPPSATPKETALIRRYYANLELPIGASAAEVKAAYRRLMRRYHPDRHATDPARTQVANELAQELRKAYEGLLEYLGAKD